MPLTTFSYQNDEYIGGSLSFNDLKIDPINSYYLSKIYISEIDIYIFYPASLNLSKDKLKKSYKNEIIDLLRRTDCLLAYIMNQEEILNLIETAVRPLRERIEHLQKQNQKLQIQMTNYHPIHTEPPRPRSITRQQQRPPKKQQIKQTKDARSPSLKKKDDKPYWNPTGRVHKPQAPVPKSPPPFDKNKYKQISPKVVTTRPQSKEKIQKPVAIKQPQKKQSPALEQQPSEARPIKGGQKFSDQATNSQVNSQKAYSVKDDSNPNAKKNPENAQSHQASLLQGGSQVLAQGKEKHYDQ